VFSSLPTFEQLLNPKTCTIKNAIKRYYGRCLQLTHENYPLSAPKTHHDQPPLSPSRIHTFPSPSEGATPQNLASRLIDPPHYHTLSTLVREKGWRNYRRPIYDSSGISSIRRIEGEGLAALYLLRTSDRDD
jgi:hypothetical protein